MSYAIVEPYLIELIRRMDEDGFPLTVAGGLGLHLKRRWVGEQVLAGVRRTLLAVVPEARPTVDIDVFLQMRVFSRHGAGGDDVPRFRRALEALNYEVHELGRHFQFVKQIAGERRIKVDLHTRLPDAEESRVVKYNRPRVGRRKQPDPPLHAYGTAEAFAIEEGPRRIPLVGKGPDGLDYSGTVQVPHPFAALCMKIQAALDFERRSPDEREAINRKHAFDVYLLVAMLDPQEVEEILELRRRYVDDEVFDAIRAGIPEFFGAAERPACRTIQGQARDLGVEGLEVARFAVVLRELFGC